MNTDQMMEWASRLAARNQNQRSELEQEEQDQMDRIRAMARDVVREDFPDDANLETYGPDMTANGYEVRVVWRPFETGISIETTILRIWGGNSMQCEGIFHVHGLPQQRQFQSVVEALAWVFEVQERDKEEEERRATGRSCRLLIPFWGGQK